MSNRTVANSGGSLISDALTYDLRDRVITATNSYRAGTTPGGTATTSYGGLGAVIAATNYSNSGESTEAFEVDALGNRTRKQQNGLRPAFHPDQLGIRFSTYDNSGHLTAVADSATGFGDQYTYSANYLYDNAGAVRLTYSQEFDAQAAVNYEEMSASYYSVDDKLRVFERRAKDPNGRAGQRPTFEEYRYDALGRRVMLRMRGAGTCNPFSMGFECASRIERVVWDGDQILIEDRVDGSEGLASYSLEQETSSGDAYGRVVYTHALGIDHPLSVSKNTVAVMPHLNWNGQYDVGTLASGASTRTCSGGPTCPIIEWSGGARSIDGENLDPHTIVAWFGNLISNKSDGSGLMYMRNRYYDPKTGRFAQQDPIGLGGGMNVYGFAGGDPVSYSDPFGLCPRPPIPCPKLRPGVFIGAAVSPLGRPAEPVVVGVSATVGNKSVAYTQGAVSGTSSSTAINSPTIGGSFDVGIKYRTASSDEPKGSIQYGFNQHLGVTVSNETIMLNIGVAVSSISPITVSVDDEPRVQMSGVPSVRPDVTQVRPVDLPPAPDRKIGPRYP